MSLTVNKNDNTISLSTTTDKLLIANNISGETVTVHVESTPTIIVSNLGPTGPQGSNRANTFGTSVLANNISASGDISSSGNVLGNTMVANTFFGNSFVGDGSSLTGVTGEWDGSHNGNASITGSLIAENIFLPGGGRISFDDSLDGTDQFISGNDHNITIDGHDKVKIKADDHVEFINGSNTPFVSINPNAGNVTMSGNISSSGNGINFLGGDLIVFGKIKSKGSDVTIMSGSITMSGNISMSAANAIIETTTGSFNHIITDGDTIEFRNAGTKAKEGTLKFDATNGLQVDDSTGQRTKIKAGSIYAGDGFTGSLSGNATSANIATTANHATVATTIIAPEVDNNNGWYGMLGATSTAATKSIVTAAKIKLQTHTGNISASQFNATNATHNHFGFQSAGMSMFSTAGTNFVHQPTTKDIGQQSWNTPIGQGYPGNAYHPSSGQPIHYTKFISPFEFEHDINRHGSRHTASMVAPTSGIWKHQETIPSGYYVRSAAVWGLNISANLAITHPNGTRLFAANLLTRNKGDINALTDVISAQTLLTPGGESASLSGSMGQQIVINVQCVLGSEIAGCAYVLQKN